MSEKKEADVVLKDGREIRFDLDLMSLADWRVFVDPKSPDEVEDGILAKVAGLPAADIPALGFIEWRRLTAALLKAVSRPLDDPN